MTKVELGVTKEGVRFGTWSLQPARPAPTLLVLANSVEGTLGDPYFRQGGNQLASQGFLCVSLDLPCHGKDRHMDEPEGLDGWRQRFDAAEDFIGHFVQRAKSVLDHIIREEMADPLSIALTGTSRGGFAAAHFMAADLRVKCAALIGPVTDLDALVEFHSLEKQAAVNALSLMALVPQLAGRPIWIVIGDQDARVGTDRAIAFARKLTVAACSQHKSSQVELHVLPEPRGHTTPAGAAEASAAWISRQLQR
ncbi:MAG TPA: prolyl oligopeptidase family serine peptidase [Pirellulales bacterium]|jgi:alpha-beta hydrolase superfamily lysophospholipase